MPAVKSSLVHPAYKTEYRVRNWRQYEQGLRSRGDVTMDHGLRAPLSPSPQPLDASRIDQADLDELRRQHRPLLRAGVESRGIRDP